jgi:hypothetical protein
VSYCSILTAPNIVIKKQHGKNNKGQGNSKKRIGFGWGAVMVYGEDGNEGLESI